MTEERRVIQKTPEECAKAEEEVNSMIHVQAQAFSLGRNSDSGHPAVILEAGPYAIFYDLHAEDIDGIIEILKDLRDGRDKQ